VFKPHYPTRQLIVSLQTVRFMGDSSHRSSRSTDSNMSSLHILESALDICNDTVTADVIYSNNGASKLSRVGATLLDLISIAYGILVRLDHCFWAISLNTLTWKLLTGLQIALLTSYRLEVANFRFDPQYFVRINSFHFLSCLYLMVFCCWNVMKANRL
jgi:hypothetical protein